MNTKKTFPPVGHKRWIIAGGCVAAARVGPEADQTSHDTACVLNLSDEPAQLQIWIFYADRDPMGPYRVPVDARRMSNIDFSELTEPAPIPPGINFAGVIESDVPVVVQHSRLDSRQAEIPLWTSLVFADTESVM